MGFGFGKKMTYEEFDRQNDQHGTLWWIGRIIILILVCGTVGVLFWRIFTSSDPKAMQVLQPNRTLADAYDAASADDRELTVYYNKELPNITYEKGRRGYFSAQRVRIIEEANQIQLLFRYNNSTIRHLKEDYSLDAVPSRDEDLYDITLYVAYDLTPDDTSDNAGNDPASVKFVRYQPTSVAAETKGLYNYRYLVFDGIDMTVTDTPVLAIYVDIYYKGDVHYLEEADGKEPYSALIIYDYAAEKTPYELTKKDREALLSWSSSSSEQSSTSES